MHGLPRYSVISCHRNAFPAIAGPGHQYSYRLNGNLGPHVAIRRQVFVWADVRSIEKKGINSILPTIEYIHGFLVHWTSIRPDATIIDDHWDKYITTIKPPSAVVSKAPQRERMWERMWEREREDRGLRESKARDRERERERQPTSSEETLSL
jgi:hypothetical protein